MLYASPHRPPGKAEESRPSKRVTVLAISPFETDHSLLQDIFSHSKWQIHGVRCRREAGALLSENPVSVVVCEKDLPDGTWKEVLEDVGTLEVPPLLIVTSQSADDHLWAEVLNLGGYDVLMKPFDFTEVVSVISLAWRHWQDNWEQVRARRANLKVAAAGA